MHEGFIVQKKCFNYRKGGIKGRKFDTEKGIQLLPVQNCPTFFANIFKSMKECTLYFWFRVFCAWNLLYYNTVCPALIVASFEICRGSLCEREREREGERESGFDISWHLSLSHTCAFLLHSFCCGTCSSRVFTYIHFYYSLAEPIEVKTYWTFQ